MDIDRSVLESECDRALVKAIKQRDLTKNTVKAIADLHATNERVEDVISACYNQDKITYEQGRNAIAAEQIYQTEKERNKTYGRLIGLVLNKMLWPSDKRNAQNYASKCMNILKSRAGKKRAQTPWWNGLVRSRDVQAIELRAECRKLEKKAGRLSLDQQIQEFYSGLDSE